MMAKTRTVAKWTDGTCIQRVDYGWPVGPSRTQVEYIVYDSQDRPLYHTKTMTEARIKAGRISTGVAVK